MGSERKEERIQKEISNLETAHEERDCNTTGLGLIFCVLSLRQRKKNSRQE